MTSKKYHECAAIQNYDDISIQKIKDSWYWVFWNDKRGNQAQGITYCPYCGEKLERH